MKVNRIVSLGVLSGVLLAGSSKSTVNTVKNSVPKHSMSELKMRPLLSVDTFKIHTFDYMDDAPVLPRFHK